MSARDEDLIGRVRGWIEGSGSPGPYCLQISPTMACDLNCLFCRRQDQLRDYYAANREIGNCRYVEMVRDALDLGTRVVIIKGGGEPLLRRSLIVELAALIKGRGAWGNIVTNGTHLDALVREAFVAAGWDQVSISLDGPDAETHDGLRDKPGAFDRIMGNVRELNALKKSRGSEAPLVAFHCVLTRRNFDALDRMIELARENEVSHVELDSMSLRFESARDLLMDESSTARFLDLLPAYIGALARSGITHNFEQFRRREYIARGAGGETLYARGTGGVPCFYPFYQASVTPAGHIVPCCYAEETHRSATNLHDLGFKDAWLKGDPAEYRRSMAAGKLLPFCKDCTAMYADNNERMRGWLAEGAHAR
ncbi:MAG: radical SAM protein [Elusimicrobia bacterium]|nr:radical SAM protein [Elusimicrobiota bacterium]